MDEPQSQDKRMQDPEYVWKMKMERWNLNRRQKPHYFRNQLVLSLLLFICIWGLFQLDSPLAEKARQVILNSLTREFQFETTSAWYTKLFKGTPTFIPIFEKESYTEAMDRKLNHSLISPVRNEGLVRATKLLQGVVLELNESEPAVAVSEGRVIFVGELQETGLTVRLQHADQLESTYGLLEYAEIEENQWVKGGQSLGETNRLYFALRHGEGYMDPMDVIPVD